MSKNNVLGGLSAVLIQATLAATATAQSQSEKSMSLPPVTVDAPGPSVRPDLRKRAHAAVAALRASAPAVTEPHRARVLIYSSGSDASLRAPAPVERYQLPQRSYGITSKRIEETVNLKDPEDAVKNLPSLFVRKRNDGDNQAVLATRSWGLNSSARSLIYYDDLLISALVGNNNSGAAPKWNLISPEAIGRVDYLDGPFAAAYPGNSLGGVLLITSKMPDKPFATAKETVSVTPWRQYGTKDSYVTSQTSAAAGNRDGRLSWLIGANYLDSHQQPLTYTTNATIPAGTVGAFGALNKQGVPANVVGTGVLASSQQTSGNLRLAYDVSPLVQATYSLGVWNNHQVSDPQSYLRSASAGAPTFAGISGFASGKYIWDQTHLSNAVSLKSDTKGAFDFDLSISTYNYLQDTQLNPFAVAPTGTGFSANGKITRMDGTNWQNADAKGIWRPFGPDGLHEISFGIHGDRYRLENPVYASSIWKATSLTGNGALYSNGVGETRTGALWLQDAWRIAPGLKLTLGGRLETWRALDGFNLNTTTTAAGAVTSVATMVQPGAGSTNFSPKASLSMDLDRDWNATASFGESYRYPTVTELYQNVVVGGVATFADPFLKPEHDLNGSLSFERKWSDGRVRLTLFSERTENAILSQTSLVTNPGTGAQTPTTVVTNVDAIRMRGVELAAEKDDVLVRGLQLFGSVTYVDSRILADAAWAGVNPLTGAATTVAGNRVPYVLEWRAKAGATYRPNDSWAYTVAARYSGKQYSTLDNTDVVSHVYGAFDDFLVVDLKVHYSATTSLAFDFGIDNVLDRQYFLFHPFPGRTFVMAAKYAF